MDSSAATAISASAESVTAALASAATNVQETITTASTSSHSTSSSHIITRTEEVVTSSIETVTTTISTVTSSAVKAVTSSSAAEEVVASLKSTNDVVAAMVGGIDTVIAAPAAKAPHQPQFVESDSFGKFPLPPTAANTKVSNSNGKVSKRRVSASTAAAGSGPSSFSSAAAVPVPAVFREHAWRPKLQALYRWENPKSSALTLFIIILRFKLIVPFLMGSNGSDANNKSSSALQKVSYVLIFAFCAGLFFKVVETKAPPSIAKYTATLANKIVGIMTGGGGSADEEDANDKQQKKENEKKSTETSVVDESSFSSIVYYKGIKVALGKANLAGIIVEGTAYLWAWLLSLEDPTAATTEDRSRLDRLKAAAAAEGRSGEEDAQKLAAIKAEAAHVERMSTIKKLVFVVLALFVLVEPYLEWSTSTLGTTSSSYYGCSTAPALPIAELVFLLCFFIMTRYPSRMLLRRLYNQWYAANSSSNNAAVNGNAGSGASALVKPPTPPPPPAATSNGPATPSSASFAQSSKMLLNTLNSSELVSTVSQTFKSMMLGEHSDADDEDMDGEGESASSSSADATGKSIVPLRRPATPIPAFLSSPAGAPSAPLTLRWFVGDLLVFAVITVYVLLRKGIAIARC